MSLLSYVELLELFTCNPKTGEIFWKERPEKYFRSPNFCKAWNIKYSGKPAGSVHTSNCGKKYHVIKLLGKTAQAHQIIYALHHGFIPKGIDHINGNGLDNRIENLREATHSENSKNVRKRVDNTTGVTGVHFDKSCNRYKVSISNNGTRLRLGNYKSIDEAVSVRKNAEYQLSYHKNHGTERPL